MIKKNLYVFIVVVISLISLSGCNVSDISNTFDPQGFFLSAVPTDDFQNLTLKNFPSVESGNWPKVVLWNDKMFVLPSLSQEVPYGPDVLEYDLKGNLIAYTNKDILTCSPNDIAVSGDYLFVSCMNVGIYKVDLVKNQVVSFYDEKNGLKNNQNLQLAIDGDTLWVGTFKGVGKIDIKTDEIKFYGPELGVGCSDEPTTMVSARNGEVWVTLIAHADCPGGASRYDAKADKWAFYEVKDFNKKDLERVDFSQFIVSDNGVYALHQDGGPDFETLSKFNAEKNVWEIVYQDKYESFNKNLVKYLPPLETYSAVEIEMSDYWKTKSISVYGAMWIDVPLVVKEYKDLILVNDVYYLLSNEGIDEFTKTDKFPRTMAKSNNIFTIYKSKLFVTDDKKHVGFFSIEYSEMGGGNSAYGVGAYNIQDKTFFDGKMVVDDFSKVFGENFAGMGIAFENLQFVYAPGEVKIPVDGGEFVIDLVNQKFVARKI